MRTCLYYFCDKKFKPKSKIHVYCCKEHRDVCAINKSKIKKRMKKVKILYGGSVNPKNIQQLKIIDNIDGFLVGGASQDSKKFIDIIKKTYN